MMEQGSLADLLTLAKSGDDNKLGEMMAMMNGGMGGQQWIMLTSLSSKSLMV